MGEKKPIKTAATVALFVVAEQIATPLIHGEPKRDVFLFSQPHTQQDGPPTSRNTGRIEMGATSTAVAELSGLSMEQILRLYRRG